MCSLPAFQAEAKESTNLLPTVLVGSTVPHPAQHLREQPTDASLSDTRFLGKQALRPAAEERGSTHFEELGELGRRDESIVGSASGGCRPPWGINWKAGPLTISEGGRERRWVRERELRHGYLQ